ncbi:hypothetical protein AUP68_03418 [Ilyonectria robusta]
MANDDTSSVQMNVSTTSQCGDNDVQVEPERKRPERKNDVDKNSLVQGFLSRKDRPWFPAPHPPPATVGCDKCGHGTRQLQHRRRH